MPDISMCSHGTCKSMAVCYRHAASGTVPNTMQSYAAFDPGHRSECQEFIPASKFRAKKLKGFAAMSPEKRRKIASMGGRSVPAEKRSFSVSKELAIEAGRRGGRNVPAKKRLFSLNPELATEAGKKGGRSRAVKKVD